MFPRQILNSEYYETNNNSLKTEYNKLFSGYDSPRNLEVESTSLFKSGIVPLTEKGKDILPVHPTVSAGNKADIMDSCDSIGEDGRVASC